MGARSRIHRSFNRIPHGSLPGVPACVAGRREETRMDGARFDGLTRALAARRSRRWATRGLMTLAGAWLALPRSAQAHYPGAAVPGGFCAALLATEGNV